MTEIVFMLFIYSCISPVCHFDAVSFLFYFSHLFQCGSIVEASLADKEMGDECIVVPYTDSHIYIAGYLLAWRLALNALTHASDANQHQYSAYLRYGVTLNFKVLVFSVQL